MAIADGRVTGVVGSVYDASGRFFTEFSPALTDLPVSEELVGGTHAGQGRAGRAGRVTRVLQPHGGA